MTALIERLEAAAEGSRELDVHVWVAANGKGQPLKTVGPPTYDAPRYFCNPSPAIDWIGYDLLATAPRYTTSLDAALTLVPEDPANLGKPMLWSIAYDEDGVGGERGYTASLGKGYHDPGYIYGHSVTTPALAVCGACLRAEATP